MRVPLVYSRRNLTVRAIATISAAGSVALVVFVVASSLMLAQGLRESLLRAGSADKAIVMQQGGYTEIGSRVNQSALALVASAPGVRTADNGKPSVSGELVDLLTLQRVDRPSLFVSVQVRGVTSEAFDIRPELRIVSGRMARPGVAEAVVGKQAAGRYRGLALSQTFELKKDMPVEVVGVFDAGGSALESEVWTDLHVLQAAAASEGYLSSITAQLESSAAFPAFAEVLVKDYFAAGIGAERERDYYEKISVGLSGMIRGLGGLIAFVFSFGAVLAAAITMYGAVAERTKEFGVLRALGFEKGDVLAAILVESAGLAVLGVGTGIIMTVLASFTDFRTRNETTGAEIAIQFAPSLPALLVAATVGVTVGVIGGLWPALRASGVDPIRAMKD